MNLLLDTCTFLRLVLEPARLSPGAGRLLADPANRVYLCVVSAWEIAVKYSLGQISLQQPPKQWIPDQRVKHWIHSLDLIEPVSLYVPTLPRVHKDPFDRMLVCQAIVGSLVILTPDPHIRQYPVQTAWWSVTGQ